MVESDQILFAPTVMKPNNKTSNSNTDGLRVVKGAELV